MRTIAVVLLPMLVCACASRPQQTLTTLNASDPKFNSPACLDIRGKAVSYDDKVGERMAVGFFSGLFLGPFGLPIAAAADARQDEERRVFNREITLRCVTGGEQVVAAQDAERAQIAAQAVERPVGGD